MGVHSTYSGQQLILDKPLVHIWVTSQHHKKFAAHEPLVWHSSPFLSPPRFLLLPSRCFSSTCLPLPLYPPPNATSASSWRHFSSAPMFARSFFLSKSSRRAHKAQLGGYRGCTNTATPRDCCNSRPIAWVSIPVPSVSNRIPGVCVSMHVCM